MKIKSLIAMGIYYPIRYNSWDNFGKYSWHREQLGLAPKCEHRKSVLISANIKTWTTKRRCLTCKQVLTTEHKIN